jgi:DeoR family transcriptional regulator of aga operon
MATRSARLRHDNLLRLLAHHQKIRVQAIAEQLGVSGWTVRRDLEALEQSGLVLRTHGSATLSDAGRSRLPPTRNLGGLSSEVYVARERIGQAAAQQIPNGSRVVLGAGNTTLEVARALGHKAGLQVMTNSLEVALELSRYPAIRTISTGGEVNGTFSTLNGSVTQRVLQSHYFDLAVISVSGIDARGGCTVQSPMNVIALDLMVKHADRLIIVADHLKFGVVAFAQLCDLDEIDLLITDKMPSDPVLVGALERVNVELVVATVNAGRQRLDAQD